MRREKKKIERVRVCVNIEKELMEKVDDYIQNLSGFFNKCLKNYIENQEHLQYDSENKDRYVKLFY